MGLLAAHARAEAFHTERKLAVAAELHRVRCAQDARDQVFGREPGEFVAAEVAVALSVSTQVAYSWMSLGTDLATRLPATRRALAAGELDYPRVRVIADRTTAVTDPTMLTDIEDRVLSEVLRPGRCTTRGQLARLVDKAVAAVDPTGVRTRQQRAVADRDITVRPDADGMATIYGALPAAGGQVLDATLRRMALEVCSQDTRTTAQLRADAVVALAHGHRGLACECGSPSCPSSATDTTHHACKPLIGVLVAAETLTGATDLPGVLAGFGVIDTDTVRALATDATWQRMLTLDGVPHTLGRKQGAGMVADPAAYRYTPSTELAARVRARDGHCRFPGCQVPAANCDLDHSRAFNHDDPAAGGLTTMACLNCLCRWHHRAKTHGYWQLTQDPDGTQHWTSPTGSTHTTTPDGLPPTTATTPETTDTWTQDDYDTALDHLIHDHNQRQHVQRIRQQHPHPSTPATTRQQRPPTLLIGSGRGSARPSAGTGGRAQEVRASEASVRDGAQREHGVNPSSTASCAGRLIVDFPLSHVQVARWKRGCSSTTRTS